MSNRFLGGWPPNPTSGGQYRPQYPPQSGPQQWAQGPRPGQPQGAPNQWDQGRYPVNQQYAPVSSTNREKFDRFLKPDVFLESAMGWSRRISTNASTATRRKAFRNATSTRSAANQQNAKPVRPSRCATHASDPAPPTPRTTYARTPARWTVSARAPRHVAKA